MFSCYTFWQNLNLCSSFISLNWLSCNCTLCTFPIVTKMSSPFCSSCMLYVGYYRQKPKTSHNSQWQEKIFSYDGNSHKLLYDPEVGMAVKYAGCSQSFHVNNSFHYHVPPHDKWAELKESEDSWRKSFLFQSLITFNFLLKLLKAVWCIGNIPVPFTWAFSKKYISVPSYIKFRNSHK